MTSSMPTVEEVDELVAFLPQLDVEGFVAIKSWGGGEKLRDGSVTVLWPVYDEIVGKLFRTASKECWCDFNYGAHDVPAMLQREGFIENADLEQLKTLLTFCVRGERFCDGHWGGMIERGYMQRILQRLRVFGSPRSTE